MQRPLEKRCRGLLAWAVMVMVTAWPTGDLRAQLFDGGGLFNRKTDPPRAQTEDEIGVPVPVTGRVEALKGHEVQFEIRAESKTPGATVEFLVRAFPSAGKIVSLVSKPNDRNKAIVVYWADPASSATNDAFSFAVRYRGGRYSSEMRYDIDLVDTKTEIQVPSDIDFGEVMVGSEVVREVTVRNLGNGSMDRQIFLAPPWHLLDPADGKLTLGPRGGRVLKIAFRPELTGETSYFLSFSRNKSGTTKLVGSGADPFQLVTEAVELELDGTTGERRGEILLSNAGSKPLAVEARASSRLESSLLEGYLLAPGQTTTVAVKLAATDTAPFDGTVEFFLKNGYAKSARVLAAVVPARIDVSVPGSLTAEVINFGQVEAGRSGERGIVITNRGGVAVPLEFHIPEPFRLLTNPGPQLGPLSSMNLSLGIVPALASRGVVDVTMTVSGGGKTVPVRLLANVVSPSATTKTPAPNLPARGFRLGSGSVGTDPLAANPGAPSPVAADLSGGTTETGLPVAPPQAPQNAASWDANLRPDQRELARSPAGFLSKELIAHKIDPTLRRPEDLTILESKSTALVVGWTAPKDNGGVQMGYLVEVRGVGIDVETGMPESIWTPYPGVKFDRVDRFVKATLPNLSPATNYEMRVVLMTEDGRSSPPSNALTAMTDLPMDWTYIYLAFGVVALVGLGLIVRKIILDRRPEVYQSQYADL